MTFSRRAAGTCQTLTLTLVAILSFQVAGAAPPATRTVDVTDELHGVKVADPYRWLETTESSEVHEWVEAQNQHYADYLARYETTRSALLAELEQAYESAVSESVPSIYRDCYFFYRRTGLQNHSVLYVRRGGFDQPEQVALDPNTFSADGTVALDWQHPSPDGGLIAYGKSAKGSEKSTLYIKDLRTSKDLPDVIPYTRACSVAWQTDGKGFVYTRYPTPGSVPAGEENYWRKVFYHQLGHKWEDDPLVFESADRTDWPIAFRSADGKYAVIQNERGWARNDLYVMPLEPGGKLMPLVKDMDATFGGDVYQGTVYLNTNLDAPRYRLVATDLEHLNPKDWREIVPQSDRILESFDIIGGRLVVDVSEDVHSRVLVHDLAGKLIQEIKLPGIGTVGGISGKPESPELFYSYTAFNYPPANFRGDLTTGKFEQYWQKTTEVKPEQYVTKQVWFASKDGTRVPMFVVHRKGLELNGQNPTLLYGYGGFNVVYHSQFRESLFPWLRRGGVYVLASIRGGGEYGREWHEAGRMAHKQNSYDDFIAAGRKLVADGYTCPEKLAIEGGSNGGLLVGAVLVQEPKLCRAVLCAVPLLDMVRYHRFRIAQLWMSELGNPDVAEDFAWLYAYSPYHHVQAGVEYPAVLLTTALEDSRVDPMHAWKMGARLQAAGSKHPVFIYTESEAGHGQGKPLKMQLKEQADEYVFLLAELGMIEPEQAKPPKPVS